MYVCAQFVQTDQYYNKVSMEQETDREVYLV